MNKPSRAKLSEKPTVAVGLEYRAKDDEAPQVSVKGEYLTAEEIVKIARRFAVPVRSNAELARALHALEVDTEIPENLFRAVATVLHELQKSKRIGKE